MLTSRHVAIVAALGAAALLTACGSDQAAIPTASLTAAASPASTAAPSAELVAWADTICTDTVALRDAVDSLAGAAITSGADGAAGLQSQFDAIQQQASALVDTAKSAPTDTSTPEIQTLAATAATAQASLNELGIALTALVNAEGVGAVGALADLTAAGRSTAEAMGATADAIDKALAGGRSTLAQAFAANASCDALTRS